MDELHYCKAHGIYEGSCSVCRKKPSASDEKGVSSDEAYHTVVLIRRFRTTYMEEVQAMEDESLYEDEYSFEIGKRTFPEVLTLVDDIKQCVELMK